VVSDAENGLPDDRRDVRVRLGGHLTGEMHLAGGDHRLHGDPAARILLQQRVQHRIADRVTHLVRMPLGHRFRGEKPTSHSRSLLSQHPNGSVSPRLPLRLPAARRPRPSPGPGPAGELWQTCAVNSELRELAPGVWAWVQPDGTWWVNNAGVIGGADGTLLVDTCATETRTRRFLAAVGQATGDAPIRLAVNTHLHGDHTYGNSLLPAETVLIGHENMRDGLRADPIIDGCPPFWSPVPDWGGVSRRLPSVTLTSELTLHLGDRRVELRHPGYAAHTTRDVVAWPPAERILVSG